jgi:hypothetical protein
MSELDVISLLGSACFVHAENHKESEGEATQFAHESADIRSPLLILWRGIRTP